MEPKLNDPEWLKLAYSTMSLQQIADTCGVCSNTVRNRLVKFGIERRQRCLHFRGKKKPASQRAKISESRRTSWQKHPDRKEFRAKISKSKTVTGIQNGYKYVYDVENGRIQEHRLVMEKAIGRKLLASEVIHHKDSNRLNNDISNLEILSSSEHNKRHHAARPRNAKGQYI